jgi:predicted HTH transcriptional regulator
MEQFDFDVTGKEILLETNIEPDKVFIHLLSKSTGEVIDYRRIYLSWNELPKGVTLGSDDYEEIIKNGESQTVEFKREIGKSLTDILETIVAFSNSIGGWIFIGVDDNAVVCGANEKDIGDRVMNGVADSCEPPIDPEISSIKVEGKDIVVIEVEAGVDKPYNYKNRGVYVRRNGTTRIASRFELNGLRARSQMPPF